MKKTLLTLLIVITAAAGVMAERSSNLSLRVGEQKTVAKGLKINFVEVTDDSRCPEGKTCIWAGNAKVKLIVSAGKKHKDLELNSDTQPTSIEYAGYRIKFVSLTRKPTQPGRMTMVRPELVLSVTKIKH
ncbi:MAG: hypothetical protein ACJ73D_09610 [Pyrinomonadaceae bacterium]